MCRQLNDIGEGTDLRIFNDLIKTCGIEAFLRLLFYFMVQQVMQSDECRSGESDCGAENMKDAPQQVTLLSFLRAQVWPLPTAICMMLKTSLGTVV